MRISGNSSSPTRCVIKLGQGWAPLSHLPALKMLPDVPSVSVAQFTDAVEMLGKTNPAIKNVDLNAVVDNSFVADAAKRLGK